VCAVVFQVITAGSHFGSHSIQVQSRYQVFTAGPTTPVWSVCFSDSVLFGSVTSIQVAIFSQLQGGGAA